MVCPTAEPTATPAAVEAMFAIKPGCRGWAGATMGGGGGGAARAGGPDLAPNIPPDPPLDLGDGDEARPLRGIFTSSIKTQIPYFFLLKFLQ